MRPSARCASSLAVVKSILALSSSPPSLSPSSLAACAESVTSAARLPRRKLDPDAADVPEQSKAKQIKAKVE
jgi:hypothetical protein